jgi:predicted NAD/FAD-binding protein
MIEGRNIAIIGGGASGLISGYLLGEKYNITLYEKEPILGGNVRTLNKNVTNTNLASNINIENGVLGFSQCYYPNFHKLLHQLGTPYLSYKPSISLFNLDKFYPARTLSYLNYECLKRILLQPDYRSELMQLYSSQRDFKKIISSLKPEDKVFEDYVLSNELYKNYLQSLFMLSFSTPFTLVPDLSQLLLNKYFETLPNSTWSFIKGGVYTYMESMLSKSKMKVICNASGLKISRRPDNIEINFQGEVYRYDAVVIATTPGSVKDLLIDMSNQERSLFSDMNDQIFKTTAHTDLSFYGPYKNVKKTPMDLFFNANGIKNGYNTYQNDVYQLNSNKNYSFAYNLDNKILNEAILSEINHTVPLYSKNYEHKIQEIKAINGQNRTFYAGAYLGNGLHEGAVESAMQLVSKLGGIVL